MDNASPNTVTVPSNSSVAFVVGTQITVRQAGAGQTTIAAGTGVTINTPETLALKGQHSAATLIKVAADEWDLTGDLETAPCSRPDCTGPAIQPGPAPQAIPDPQRPEGAMSAPTEEPRVLARDDCRRRRAEDHWHLDKRIPLALIVTIVMQTLAATWWAASVDARLTFVEDTAATSREVSERITRLEVQQQELREDLRDLIQLLRQNNGGMP